MCIDPHLASASGRCVSRGRCRRQDVFQRVAELLEVLAPPLPDVLGLPWRQRLTTTRHQVTHRSEYDDPDIDRNDDII
jgi:hypothetical protein